ncbi:GNAT family N-acetyltransferase [Sciscionella sediminilitoris]|uniref:GNAT family N-acetyltransferase n=1 Tax=Sciscionella sediminilitoris TaxID=1445613 RepID=UPI0018D1A551|nr:GNAT family N-acetyltransferase [Sciscionella sp. SE31]
MRLHTERLLLRPFTEDDLGALHSWDTDPEVVRYLRTGIADLATSEEQLTRRIANTALPRQEGERIHFAVQLASEAVGTRPIGEVNLDLVSTEHSYGEIGYVFDPDHNGKGYATEAARELLRFGFDELGLHRITARCYPENHASTAVMRRLGMREEAHYVANEWLKGEWADEGVWAILEREWRGRCG